MGPGLQQSGKTSAWMFHDCAAKLSCSPEGAE